MESSRTTERAHAIRLLLVAQLVMLVANLGRIPLFALGGDAGGREAPLIVNDICVLAVLAVAGGELAARQRLRLDRVGLLAILFVAIGAAAAVRSVWVFGLTPFELLASLAYLARWVAYFGLYVVIINSARETDVEPIWNAVEVMLVVFAAFGIVQSAFLPDFAQRVYPDSRPMFDWDVQGRRLVSTVLEPNIAGAMLMLGLLVQFGRISTGARVSWLRVLVLFTGLGLTVSRSATAGLLVGVLVIVGARGLSRQLARAGVIIGALFLAATPLWIPYAASFGRFNFGAGTSAGIRVTTWLRALMVFADHPIFGIGFNTYGFVGERYGFERIGAASYSLDGGLLMIAMLTGVVGLTAYCWMLYRVMSRCRAIWRDARIPAASRGIAIGVGAGVIALVVESVFVNSILTTFVMEIQWVLFGLTFVIHASRERVQHEPPGVQSADMSEPRQPALVALSA